jgi:hypothetical protein
MDRRNPQRQNGTAPTTNGIHIDRFREHATRLLHHPATRANLYPSARRNPIPASCPSRPPWTPSAPPIRGRSRDAAHGEQALFHGSRPCAYDLSDPTDRRPRTRVCGKRLPYDGSTGFRSCGHPHRWILDASRSPLNCPVTRLAGDRNRYSCPTISQLDTPPAAGLLPP